MNINKWINYKSIYIIRDFCWFECAQSSTEWVIKLESLQTLRWENQERTTKIIVCRWHSIRGWWIKANGSFVSLNSFVTKTCSKLVWELHFLWIIELIPRFVRSDEIIGCYYFVAAYTRIVPYFGRIDMAPLLFILGVVFLRAAVSDLSIDVAAQEWNNYKVRKHDVNDFSFPTLFHTEISFSNYSWNTVNSTRRWKTIFDSQFSWAIGNVPCNTIENLHLTEPHSKWDWINIRI